MPVTTGTVFYPRNDTTVDTAAGIDIRLLGTTGAAADVTQSVRFTHTQDGQKRTFDPGNALVTTVSDPVTFQGEGWAIQVTDLTPADDTNCNAYLQAGTTGVDLDVNLKASGGTNLGGGTNTITFRASLWRYNPTTDTGTLIAAGSQTQTWSTGIGGDNNTYKTVTVNITVPSTEFLQGEILLLQIGCDGTTLVDATLGTTNYDITLRLASVTKLSFTGGQHLTSLCAFTGSSAGAATGSASATRVLGVIGSSTGVASVSGNGAFRASTTGAAAASATVAGQGSSVAGTVGAATASATASGQASRVLGTTGTSAVSGGTTTVIRPIFAFDD